MKNTLKSSIIYYVINVFWAMVKAWCMAQQGFGPFYQKKKQWPMEYR